MFVDYITQLNMILPILLSVLLGFIIGFERKTRMKEAGIRTHSIVCLGSCLMMVISKFAFGSDADSARVAAQIVAGVGFLGAGMIVYKQNQVHGLTTAAGVWATAGVGMACGGGLYVLAVGATIVLILMQSLFHLNFKLFKQKKYYSIKIKFKQNGRENLLIKQIFGTSKFNHLVLKKDDGEFIYEATLNTDVEYRSELLNEIMNDNDFIISIERIDND